MNVRDIPNDELVAELERRKNAQEVGLPVPIENPDFAILKKTVTDGVHYAIKDGYRDEDFAQYVFEAAVEAVYGREFWKWWNTIG